tara:strand:+ start:471 stop:2276 length:1806 start_codon:yes stop_codon:yes gene_type:complete
MQIDCLALVQDWVDGTKTNHGFRIGGGGSSGTSSTWIFRSSNYGTAGERPKLEIVYTVEATYVVEADWNKDGDYDDTGEDITARVFEAEFGMGRVSGSQLESRSMPGYLRLTVDNQSGDYSPFNTGGPLGTNVKPGRPIRIRATAPTTDILWTGKIRTILPVAAPGGNQAVEITGVGPLGALAQREVRTKIGAAGHPSALIEDIKTGAAFIDHLAEIGSSSQAATIDGGQTTMKTFYAKSGTKLLAALRELEATESGFIREGRDGKIYFEDRHHRLKSPHQTIQARWLDGASSAASSCAVAISPVRVKSGGHLDPLQHIYNIFEAEVTKYQSETSTASSCAVLWTSGEDGAGGDAPSIEAGLSREFWVKFPNEESSGDAIGVNAWRTPVAPTHFTARSAADGTGTNHNADITVSVVKYADAMKITLTNNAAVTVFICGPTPTTTGMEARGKRVKIKGDSIRVAKDDATSRSDYGERSWPHPGNFIPDSGEALSWANSNLAVYKDPIAIAKVTLDAQYDTEVLEEVLTRDISERIRLRLNSTKAEGTQMGIDEDFFIERVDHRITDGGKRHLATYELSPAKQFSDFWVIGKSALGTNTRLAY